MVRYVNRRAQLLRVTLPHGLKAKTLQEHLLDALKSPLVLDKTEIASPTFGSLRINSAPKTSPGGGLCLKLVGHAPQEMATTVPLKLAAAKRAESTAKPPKLQSFKNCDFFLVVSGNDVMGLGDHMRIETAVKYIRQLLCVRLSNSKFAALTASSVFRYDAAKQLKEEGIRAIEFDASLSAAALDMVKAEKYRGPIRGMLSGLSESMSAVLRKDVDPGQLADVNVSVTLSVRGGINGADLAQRAVEKTALDLAGDDEAAGGIPARIVTKRGNRVSVGSATVGREFRLQRRQNENSVIDVEAWTALEEFEAHVQELGPLRT